MKIRLDFVTNSSSTNFIVGWKKKSLTEENFMKAIGVLDDSPLRPIYQNVFRKLTNKLEEVKPTSYRLKNYEEAKNYSEPDERDDLGEYHMKKYGEDDDEDLPWWYKEDVYYLIDEHNNEFIKGDYHIGTLTLEWFPKEDYIQYLFSNYTINGGGWKGIPEGSLAGVLGVLFEDIKMDC